MTTRQDALLIRDGEHRSIKKRTVLDLTSIGAKLQLSEVSGYDRGDCVEFGFSVRI